MENGEKKNIENLNYKFLSLQGSKFAVQIAMDATFNGSFNAEMLYHPHYTDYYRQSKTHTSKWMVLQ